MSGWKCLGITALLMGAATGCSSGPKQPANSYNPVYKSPDPALDITPQQANERISAETHFAAAQLAEGQGRLPAAVDQYRRALQVDANHVPSLYGLARIFTLSRNYSQAIPAWERYVRATNEDPSAWNNLARCYELADQWADAEASYLRALQRSPEHRQTRINYGLMLAKRDRIDESREQLAKVLPETAVEYNLGSVYELRGMKKQASERYRAALALDPNMREAAQRLAGLR
jgi:tetratricopeptide (TPR) repeat protein